MKHRIVLMAKSKKGKDGYCVAGIDSDSGEWVRLNVPGYYSIPKDMFKYSDGTEPELLDLISVEITGKDNRDTWQPENHFCRYDMTYHLCYTYIPYSYVFSKLYFSRRLFSCYCGAAPFLHFIDFTVFYQPEIGNGSFGFT